MHTIRVTKQFNFEMAHALFEYDGPCKNLHGHSYYLQVTIKGEVQNQTTADKNGMVMDFGDLKKIVKPIVEQLDHATMLNKKSAETFLTKDIPVFGKLILVDFQPTCENILLDIALKLKQNLPSQIHLHSLLLRETPTSFAEWFAEDNL